MKYTAIIPVRTKPKNKKFILQEEMKNLLSTGSYYPKYNRAKLKKNKFEVNYHGIVLDPDGNKRNLNLGIDYELLEKASLIRSMSQNNFFKSNKIPKWLLDALGKNYFKRAHKLTDQLKKSLNKI